MFTFLALSLFSLFGSGEVRLSELDLSRQEVTWGKPQSGKSVCGKPPYELKADLTGAQTVTLIATTGGDSHANDLANWCDASWRRLFDAKMSQSAQGCASCACD